MTARLPTVCLMLAGLCGVGWCISAAAAKPPDLPIREVIMCAPAPADHVQDPLAADEEEDTHVRAARDAALRTATRCLLFAANPLLALLPVEEWLEDDDAAKALPPVVTPTDQAGRPAGQPVEEFTCPYLGEKVRQEQERPPEAALPGSVLDNLEKLNQAARIYDKAELDRLAGRFAGAQHAYESIRRLCPGSRFSLLAEQQLKRLQTQQTHPTEKAAGEEEDSFLPSPMIPSYGIWIAGGVELVRFGQSSDLLQRFSMYFKQGLYAEAELCAREALALDPSNPTAQLAAHLAAMLRLDHGPVSEPAPCPWAAEAPTPMHQPEPPPVDPGLAGAMDRILIDAAESAPPTITVIVEENGTAEEQSEAEEDAARQEAAASSALQDVLDALRSVAWVDLDVLAPRFRGRWQWSVGSLVARISWDFREAGASSFTVSLRMDEPAGESAER
jgi:tetratricopeptide (TPR) repeat protein